MTNRFILSFALAMAAVSSASALSISLTPGKLKNSMADLKYTRDNALVLSGTADVTDLALLKDISRSITTLDMSKLNVVAYTYVKGDYMGQKTFVDGELPKAMLLGSSIKNFTFPENTTIIGSSAFASSALVSVTVPLTVTFIGDGAWSNCRKLKTVSLMSEATLGSGLFKDCDALLTSNFGYAITEIPSSMFDGCSAYVSPIPSTVTSIGASSFRGTALHSLNLSAVTSVGDFAFAEMPYLKDVTIDAETSTTWGKGVFFGDEGLEELPAIAGNIPDLFTAHASSDTTNLTISSPVIGEAAYANNTDLKAVFLMENVSEIKANAFRNAVNLELVNVSQLSSTPPEVDATAFSGLENSSGRYNAHLNVADGTQLVWSEHPVWGLFDVVAGGSEVVAVFDTPKISINRNRNNLLIECSHPIDFIGLYSVGGLTLLESAPNANTFSSDALPENEIVVAKIISGKHVQITKIK